MTHLSPSPPEAAFHCSPIVLATLLAGFGATACGGGPEPSFETESALQATEGDGLYSTGLPGGTADESSADETGSPPPQQLCYNKEGDGLTGFVHQCGGYANVEFSYWFDGEEIVDYADKSFGNGVDGDPYKYADVYACCDPIDDSVGFQETPHFDVCHDDLAVHVCANLEGMLNHAVAIQGDPDAAADLASVRDWFVANKQACAQGFFNSNTPYDENTGAVTWSFFLGSQDPLTYISLPTLDFEWQVTDIYLPSEAGQTVYTCDHNASNDPAGWSGGGDDVSDFTLETADASAALIGPHYAGGTVSSRIDLDAAENLLKFSYTGANEWTLHSLTLYAPATLIVGNSSTTVDVTDFHLELLNPVAGLSGTTTKFTVPSGVGNWLAVGLVNGAPYAIPVDLVTDLVVKDGGTSGWYTAGTTGFQYVDGSSDTWNFTFSSEGWR